MHFPWKKVKSTRISKLVNDHIHNSQKRRDGSSLVVETGFPTSLVDLFIKNREKLKKPSKKNRQNQRSTSLSDANDPLIAESPICDFPPVIPPSSTGSTSPVTCYRSNSPSPLRQSLSLASNCVNEIPVMESRYEKERGDGKGVDANRVLLGVLKMFVVVVLALGTKRLAVGITISAFLLFFLEYVAKHASGLLKQPCSVVEGVLMSIVQIVRRLLRFQDVKLEENKCGSSMQQEYSMDQHCSSRMSSRDQEIQIEPKGNLATLEEEIQPPNEIIDAPCFRQHQLIELLEKQESINATEFKRKSRRAKMKSKMKKFVPKKLRGSKKENDHQMPELVEDHTVSLTKEQLDKCTYDTESENARESSVSTGLYREEDNMSVICASSKFSETSEEAVIEKEEIGAGRAWRLLALCLIVFIGLIGGRAFALVLALLWCLLLKLGEKLPIFKSFNDKSD